MNKYNEEGQKHGYWEYEEDNNSILVKASGEVIKTPKPLIYKGYYTNGKKEGEWLVVHKNNYNKIRERLHFINDKMNGEQIMYGVSYTKKDMIKDNVLISSDLIDKSGNKIRNTLYY